MAQFPGITPPRAVAGAVRPCAGAPVLADTVTPPFGRPVDGVQGTAHASPSSSNDGSSTVTATFDVGHRLAVADADTSLLPGRCVRVRVHLGEQPGALLVPGVAVGSSQLGRRVSVAGDGDGEEQRRVVPGAPHDGGLLAVTGDPRRAPVRARAGP